MTLLSALSLFSIMLVMALIPSASVALVVARSATAGTMNGIAVAMGIVFGDLVFILLVVFGLAVLAETIAWLFTFIKYIGAAYLLWLGFSLLKSTNKNVSTVTEPDQKGSLVVSFLSGFLLTLGDIKAIFFYISLFPIFINLKALNGIDIGIIIAITIVAVGGAKIFYALFAQRMKSVSSGIGSEKLTRKVAGGLMIGAGGYLIVKT